VIGWLRRLPGPAWVRAAVVVALAAALAALMLAGYEWLGRAFLDTGGTMG
jgi:hypothetical protein